ncbi:MAG: TIGR03936 family radical SAM-associated protein [Oscillospiraceae bacterium]
MASVNTRIFFSKTDRAKYISHLDLYGVVQRSIKRAKLPVWYTEGFNPRMYVQFMLPLSLGQEGLREAADFRLLEDIPHEEVTERLNNALPLDIRVVETSVPVKKNTDIASAEYEITADIDNAKFLEFTNLDAIMTEKKTKRGVTEIDLKPCILSVEAGEKIMLKLPAGNEFNINPQLLLSAFEKYFSVKIKKQRIVRTKIFCADGSEFI